MSWYRRRALLLTVRRPAAGAWPTKPGSATLPFFGVHPVLLSEKGEELAGATEGILAIKGAWPSMFRDLYGNHQRYEETYFGPYKARSSRALCRA